MKKILLIALLQLTAVSLLAQEKSFWTAIQLSEQQKKEILFKREFPQEYQTYSLDVTALQTALASITRKGELATATVSVPDDKGVLEAYTVSEASVMDPALQAQFPNIR